MSASFVLASLRASTYIKGTPRLLASLRPRRTDILSILLGALSAPSPLPRFCSFQGQSTQGAVGV